jgi:hypothetical protein
MDRKYPKETNRFQARDDNGTPFTIIEFTEFIEASSRAGTETVPGMKSLKTTSGHSVNRVDKGKFQVAVLGLALHSDDAETPEGNGSSD